MKRAEDRKPGTCQRSKRVVIVVYRRSWIEIFGIEEEKTKEIANKAGSLRSELRQGSSTTCGGALRVLDLAPRFGLVPAMGSLRSPALMTNAVIQRWKCIYAV
jgi:hypothetical protein